MTTSETSIAELFEATTAPIAVPRPSAEKRHKGGSRYGNPKAPATDALHLGDYPVARLLPPEVVAQGKVRTTRTIVTYLVIAVVIAAALGIAGAHLYAQGAQSRLAAVQAKNATVLAQQAKYAPARTADNQVKLAQAAQRVGSSGEIDWNAYLGKIQAVLPAGVTITDISGETSSPAAAVAQDSAPLSLGRGAVVNLMISAPDQDSIAATLDQLQSLPGYAGAFPGAMTQGTDASGSASSASQSWTAPITLSLNASAFDNRFANNEKK